MLPVSSCPRPVAEICRRYQVKELAVFGSAVKGEMRPDRDVDLLVDFLPGAPATDHAPALRRQLAGILQAEFPPPASPA